MQAGDRVLFNAEPALWLERQAAVTADPVAEFSRSPIPSAVKVPPIFSAGAASLPLTM